MKILTPILALALAFLNSQGQTESLANAVKSSPWFYRGPTDGHADLITIGLGRKVFASYSAANGSLSQVWKAKLAIEEREGASLPCLTRRDLAVLVDAATPRIWELRDGDSVLFLTSEYEGIRSDDKGVTIRSKLQLEGLESIQIEETPSLLGKEELDALYAEIAANPSAEWPFDENHATMFVRHIQVARLPQKGQLVLHWSRTRKSLTSVEGAKAETDRQQPGYDVGPTEPILLSIDSSTVMIYESIEM